MAEHALADDARREEVDMLFEHHEKLYSKGRSSSIQSYVKSMSAVVVALPLSGDTAHKPPKGGLFTLNDAEMCSKVLDSPSLESMSFNLYVPGLKSKLVNWRWVSVDFWRSAAVEDVLSSPSIWRSHQVFNAGAWQPADSTIDALNVNGNCGDTSGGGSSITTTGEGVTDASLIFMLALADALESLRDTVTSKV